MGVMKIKWIGCLSTWLKKVKTIQACKGFADNIWESKFPQGYFILQNNKEILLFQLKKVCEREEENYYLPFIIFTVEKTIEDVT